MSRLFRYAAVDAAGAARRGVLAAEDDSDAAAQLRRAALSPVSIRPAVGRGRRRAPLADRAAAMRRLAALIAARAPYDRALRLAGAAGKARPLFDDLALAVGAGRPLSAALADWPEDFPVPLRALVAAGERAGAMARALDAAAAMLEREAAGRRAVAAALAYPAFLLLAALGAVAVFVGFAAPRFQAVLAAAGAEPAPETAALFAAAAFLRDAGPALLAAVAALGLGAALLSATAAGRARLATLALRLPLAGPLLRDRGAEAYAAALGAMLAGGATAQEAARLAAPAFAAPPLAQAAARAGDAMAAGTRLSAALAAEPALPGDLAVFAEIGEETGDLPALMARAAAHFAAEAEARARLLGAVAGPAMTATLGLLIGLAAWAMMAAVIDVYDAAL